MISALPMADLGAGVPRCDLAKDNQRRVVEADFVCSKRRSAMAVIIVGGNPCTFCHSRWLTRPTLGMAGRSVFHRGRSTGSIPTCPQTPWSTDCRQRPGFRRRPQSLRCSFPPAGWDRRARPMDAFRLQNSQPRWQRQSPRSQAVDIFMRAPNANDVDRGHLTNRIDNSVSAA